jgi:hypothetical protein
MARCPEEILTLGSDALRLAAVLGHDAVVELLIKHPALSPNTTRMSPNVPSHLVMSEYTGDDGPMPEFIADDGARTHSVIICC